MPTYQYSCTECGHFFEQFQSFSDDALTTCPECEGRLRKVFNAVGVVFKGSGFYRTDSRAGSKAEAKSEAKTEAKTESATSGTSGNGSAAPRAKEASSSGASSASSSGGTKAAG